MKTQFIISAVCALENGRIALAGRSIGPRLTAGKFGHVAKELEGVDVEIISIGIVDPTPTDPNTQALQVRLLRGSVQALQGATLYFD